MIISIPGSSYVLASSSRGLLSWPSFSFTPRVTCAPLETSHTLSLLKKFSIEMGLTIHMIPNRGQTTIHTRPYKIAFQHQFSVNQSEYRRFLLFILLNCYMFRSYDHLQVEIYLLENHSTDNGSVVFRILVNVMDNYSDGFA
jgi:hypothetical protein